MKGILLLCSGVLLCTVLFLLLLPWIGTLSLTARMLVLLPSLGLAAGVLIYFLLREARGFKRV